ncbi:hypothetical protein [uncultured Muribaculum sp.]|uniref:hypothetical protein n=1 Tax=uncultured Muribaculum sp. TaxID=1918613 RepID=UPI0025E46353|nr:hypothetical protein [uncultured Muribaculum sp.]
MKKIYSFLASVLALASASTADAASVTFIVDNPAAVNIVSSTYVWDDETSTGGYVETPLVDPVQDVNVVTVGADEYVYAYVKAKEGYAIASVKKDDVEQTYSINDSWSTSISSYSDGYVYVISTMNLDEVRTSSVEITIDDPSKVRVSRKGGLGGDLTLTSGSQTVKFDPATENQIKIVANSPAYPINFVKLNGEKVEKVYGQYQVDVKDGDKIEIAANFPDEDYLVKIVVPEGLEGAFLGFVNYNDQSNLEGNFFEGVQVHAGTSLRMNLNTTDYNVEDILVNGISTQKTYWDGVIDQPYTFEIKGYAFENFVFEVNVDDPARVNVYNGGKWGGTLMELVAGVNEVTLKESKYGTSFYVEPTEGNIIKSVRIVNGDNESTQLGGNFTIKKGDKMYITSAVKEPDTKLFIWVDPAAVNSIKNLVFKETYGSKVFGEMTVESGINVFNYCYSDLSMQMDINVKHPDPIPDGYMPWSPFISFNDKDAEELSYIIMRNYDYEGQPAMTDGDILRIFYEQPEKATVAVTLSEAVDESKIAVEVDTRAVADWSSMSLFKGSTVKIIPATADDGKTIKCNVDGKPVSADADGNFSFTVTGDHNVALDMSTTGVDGIASDVEGAAKVVYNLQGIRMPDAENLPAGIYIINGKKVAVK